MPIGTKMATKAVKRTVKKEAKDAVGLDSDQKPKNKHGKKGKKKSKKRGRGML